MNDFEIKAKIVRAGDSRVFNDWHEQSGISMEEFIEGLRWVCEDPATNGILTRELGCVRRWDAGYTPEQIEWMGTVKDDGRKPGLVRLKRVYYNDGSFAGFYDEDGRLWGHNDSCASISCRDRI